MSSKVTQYSRQQLLKMQLYALLFGCWASIFVHKYAEYANGLGDRENRWRKKKKKNGRRRVFKCPPQLLIITRKNSWNWRFILCGGARQHPADRRGVKGATGIAIHDSMHQLTNSSPDRLFSLKTAKPIQTSIQYPKNRELGILGRSSWLCTSNCRQQIKALQKLWKNNIFLGTDTILNELVLGTESTKWRSWERGANPLRRLERRATEEWRTKNAAKTRAEVGNQRCRVRFLTPV